MYFSLTPKELYFCYCGFLAAIDATYTQPDQNVPGAEKADDTV